MCTREESNFDYKIRNLVSYPLNDGCELNKKQVEDTCLYLRIKDYNLNIFDSSSDNGISVRSLSSGKYFSRFSRIGKGFSPSRGIDSLCLTTLLNSKYRFLMPCPGL